MNTSGLRILVVGPSWVGDMVMAQSLFIALKSRYSGCVIDVLAPGWSKALLERMPEVNQAITLPLGHGQFGLGLRYQLGRQLKGQYQLSIVLPNSWKSALIPFFASIPHRQGYVGEWRYGLINQPSVLDKKRLTMTVQRFVALAQTPEEFATGIEPNCPRPQLITPEDSLQQVIQRFKLETHQKILILCPGAEYGAAKRWPAEHFASLARKSLDSGLQVWLMGSEKDRVVTNKINELTNNQCMDFAGKTSLAEAVDLLSLADTVVSNDSGLMHVAAALGKRVIALYGSSDPGFTPPLSENAVILSLKLSCSPCFKRECPLGTTACLNDLLPDSVVDLVQ